MSRKTAGPDEEPVSIEALKEKRDEVLIAMRRTLAGRWMRIGTRVVSAAALVALGYRFGARPTGARPRRGTGNDTGKDP